MAVVAQSREGVHEAEAHCGVGGRTHDGVGCWGASADCDGEPNDHADCTAFEAEHSESQGAQGLGLSEVARWEREGGKSRAGHMASTDCSLPVDLILLYDSGYGENDCKRHGS